MPQFSMRFRDDGGEVCVHSFYTDTDANALLIANELAGQSDASWDRLTKFEVIDASAELNFGGAAVAGRSVREKAKCIYAGPGNSNPISVEIPAPDAAVVTVSSRVTTTDPLITNSGALDSEEGGDSGAFQQATYLYRDRKAA